MLEMTHAAPSALIPSDFTDRAAQAIDDVIGKGDLGKLSPSERVNYYRRTCESIGLNPLTKPFEYVQFQGQLRLYANKGCSDQLRKLNKVSIPAESIVETYDPQSGLLKVQVRAVMPDGREDTDFGSVSLKGLTGEALANATMKAITKAKRRVTLSICGLGWLDETEVETIPGAQIVTATDDGDILLDTRTTRDGTPRAERTPPQERMAQEREAPNSEDLLKLQRVEKRDALIGLLKALPEDERSAWLDRFESKYGLRDVRYFSIPQYDEAGFAVQNKEWPHEAEFQEHINPALPDAEEDDPFAPAQMAALMDVPVKADAAKAEGKQKGHGDS